MKQLTELIPLALFFITYQLDGTNLSVGALEYQFDGIFSATAVLIIATTAQVVLTRLITGHLEKRLLWLLGAVVIFGGATLVFRDQTFIYWKPTVFNWALAVVFAGSEFIGEKNLMARTLGTQLALPDAIWQRLNWTWVGYFVLVGTLNLIVAYQFPEAFWVSYKFYSAFGFTLLISALTAIIVAPHLKDEDEDGEQSTEHSP